MRLLVVALLLVVGCGPSSDEYPHWCLTVFTTDNCPPCHEAMAALIDMSNGELHGTLLVAIKHGEHPDVEEEFGVQEFPTFLLYDLNGVRKMRHIRIGWYGSEDLLRWISNAKETAE